MLLTLLLVVDVVLNDAWQMHLIQIHLLLARGIIRIYA